MLTKTGEASTGSRWTAPLRGSCAAIVGLAQASEWLLKGLFFWPRLFTSLAVDGGWKRADTQVRPYKRYPVGADALVGPRQPPG